MGLVKKRRLAVTCPERFVVMWQVEIEGRGWKAVTPDIAAFVASRDPGRVRLADVAVPFSLPFAKHRRPWIPAGVTPRRLAAARRALQTQRNKVALFADHLAAEQPTPEERVERALLSSTELDREMRTYEANQRKKARRKLAAMPADQAATVKIRLLGWFGPRSGACAMHLMRQVVSGDEGRVAA